jgi:hypothetical protein
MVIDLAVAEQVEQPLHFFVGDRPTQANVVYIDHWHQDRRFVRENAEMKKPARRPENSFFFDFFDDA